MKYTVPIQSSIFEFKEKLNTKTNDSQNQETKTISNNFSRETKNKFMDKFINKINKY